LEHESRAAVDRAHSALMPAAPIASPLSYQR
jgi:hypothetical protein